MGNFDHSSSKLKNMVRRWCKLKQVIVFLSSILNGGNGLETVTTEVKTRRANLFQPCQTRFQQFHLCHHIHYIVYLFSIVSSEASNVFVVLVEIHRTANNIHYYLEVSF